MTRGAVKKTWVQLREICIVNPKMPELDDSAEVSFVPMQKITEDGQIDSSEFRKVRQVKKGFTYFQDNDVLLAKITPCMENGKGALATSLKNGIGFGSTEFHVLRPNPKVVYSKWLYYVTVWDVFRRECEKHMTGSAGQKRVPKIFVENFQVHLPSIEQQHHIVANLDNVCNLISMRKQQLAKLDELVKARFVEMFGNPIHNNKQLPLKMMPELCDIIDGDRGKNYPKQEEFFENEYCLFLNAKNVTNVGFNFKKCLYITKEKDLALRNGKLQRGDVVLTTRGTIGNLAYYSNEVPYEHIRINSGMVILRMKKSEIMELFFIEQFRIQLEEIKKRVASGSAQPQLPISTMNQIKMIIPSLSTQKQFCQFVVLVYKSKLTIQQGLDKLEMMKKALMQQYFG